MNEFERIAFFVDCLGHPGEKPVLGSGDDAALWKLLPGEVEAASVDLLVEDVHFRRSYCTASEIGYKAIAVNVSDLAAMGARPRFGLVGLAVPKNLSTEWIESFADGIREACERYKFTIVGGDLTGSPGPIMISITAIGAQQDGKALLRSGAQAGDDLWVAGWLGLSRVALEALEVGKERRDISKACLEAYLRPEAKVEEGMWLAEEGLATSAIDISDGLLGDLSHILERSGTGAKIEVARLPLHSEMVTFFSGVVEKAREFSLRGGEDYALLFTVPGKFRNVLRKKWEKRFSCPLHRIGKMKDQKGFVLIDENGVTLACEKEGYDHFKKK